MKIINLVFLAVSFVAMPLISRSMTCHELNATASNARIKQILMEVLRTEKPYKNHTDYWLPIVSVQGVHSLKDTEQRLNSPRLSEKRDDGLRHSARQTELANPSGKSLILHLGSEQAVEREIYSYILSAHSKGELVPFMKDQNLARIEIKFKYSAYDSLQSKVGTFKPQNIEIFPTKDGDMVIGLFQGDRSPEDSSQGILRIGAAGKKSFTELMQEMRRAFDNPMAQSYQTVGETAARKLQEVLGWGYESSIRSTMSHTMAVDLLNLMGYEFNPTDSSSRYWQKISTEEKSPEILAAVRYIIKNKLVYVSHGFNPSGLYPASEVPYSMPVTGSSVREAGLRKQGDDISKTAMYLDLVKQVELHKAGPR